LINAQKKESTMKSFIKTSLFAVIMALPVAASAQTSTIPQTDTPRPGTTMMNCPMMAGMDGMQNDLRATMSEVESMMKDTKDAAQKERLQKMQGRMSSMMTSMGGMMMGMKSGQPQGSASAPPATLAPTTPPSDVSPEDHEAHHPAQ